MDTRKISSRRQSPKLTILLVPLQIPLKKGEMRCFATQRVAERNGPAQKNKCGIINKRRGAGYEVVTRKT